MDWYFFSSILYCKVSRIIKNNKEKKLRNVRHAKTAAEDDVFFFSTTCVQTQIEYNKWDESVEQCQTTHHLTTAAAAASKLLVNQIRNIKLQKYEFINFDASLIFAFLFVGEIKRRKLCATPRDFQTKAESFDVLTILFRVCRLSAVFGIEISKYIFELTAVVRSFCALFCFLFARPCSMFMLNS